MNKLVLFFSMFILFSCASEKKEAPVVDENGLSYYGAKITADNAMNMSDFLTHMEGKDEATVKIKGEIIQTCAKKGCWMEVKLPGADDMMVKFKDYEFFVPTGGVEGKTAIMEGKAFTETVSVADLQHYAEDAGKTKEEIALITEPETKLGFTATGVIIE